MHIFWIYYMGRIFIKFLLSYPLSTQHSDQHLQTLHSLFRKAANFTRLLLLNQYQWLGAHCEIPTGSIRTEIIKLSASGFMVNKRRKESTLK